MGGWGGGGYGCVRGCPMHGCMHMNAFTHACTCMLNMVNMLNMDASMLAAICNFYTCIHVHACVGDTPHAPDTPHPPAPFPELQGALNHQNSISLELIEIIRFCLKISLPLNTPELIWTIVAHPGLPPTHLPHPQSQGNPNQKNCNNFWTKWDNSILFEDLGPLNSPADI